MPKCLNPHCNVEWISATVQQPDGSWVISHEDMLCAWCDSKSELGRNFGYAEMAREIGISRERVRQKVQRCQNPYIKLKPGRRKKKSKNSGIEVKLYEMFGWECPNCQSIQRITKLKRKINMGYCKQCNKFYKLNLKNIQKEMEND